MEYLYGEIPSVERKEIEQHLQTCSVCREQFRRFRDTHAVLDKWRLELPVKHRFVPQWSGGLKWAAAALVLMSTAYATGHGRVIIRAKATVEEPRSGRWQGLSKTECGLHAS